MHGAIHNLILSLAVPPHPDLMDITVSPLSDYGFFAGLDLTFTCNITLDSTINTPVIVQRTWNRNGTVLTSDGNRITVMSSPMSTPPYTTSVQLNPVRISDTGTYTCAVTVTPENRTYVTGMTYTQSQSITIGGIICFTVYNIILYHVKCYVFDNRVSYSKC